jgi:hypothetical protein
MSGGQARQTDRDATGDVLPHGTPVAIFAALGLSVAGAVVAGYSIWVHYDGRGEPGHSMLSATTGG